MTFQSFVFLLPLALSAQSFSIDDSLNQKTVANPQISPDGRYVAYTLQSTDWQENAFINQIWIAPLNGDAPYQLTHHRRSSSFPRWSPDSRRLAFASDRDGKRQIYLISPSGGEALQLTHDEHGVETFDWSPDGAAIAYTSPGPESKSLKDRRDKFGDFQIIDEDRAQSQLWLQSVASTSSKPEPLTSDPALSIESFSFSPDGRHIAFEAQSGAGYAFNESARIYVLDLSTRAVRQLLDLHVPNHRPVWSPDGTQIAFITSEPGKPSFYANLQIAVIPAAGGAPRTLTADFDENARLLAWSPQGIYFGVFRLESTLFRLDPSSKKRERINPPGSLGLAGASFTRDFSRLAGTAIRPNRFAEIFVSSTTNFQPRYLTSMNNQRNGRPFATREVIQWKSTDGTTIEGILIKPANFDPSRKYPLLVVIHGGPAFLDNPSYTPDKDYPIEGFAAKGAVVLRPNYRGSTGYGEKFRSLNVRNLGLGDYQDVISGVDHLIAQGIADKDRLGVMGWSQGGYISAFASTYSDRFKAISVGAGISDWTTYYVNTDIHFFTQQYLLATPWDDPEIYRKTSPISYLKSAKTPTLIQHGSRDARVPVPNAFELYQALKDRGVPTKLILYTDFGHNIDKPKQQRAVMEHNYQWFSKYIWNEPGN